MHENEFRIRLRAALGEAPDEAGAAQRAAAVLRQRARAEEGPRHSLAMALIAVALTLLVLGGLLGPRLVRLLQAPAPVPAGAPTPPAGPRSVGECRVPLIVIDDRALSRPAPEASARPPARP